MLCISKTHLRGNGSAGSRIFLILVVFYCHGLSDGLCEEDREEGQHDHSHHRHHHGYGLSLHGDGVERRTECGGLHKAPPQRRGVVGDGRIDAAAFVEVENYRGEIYGKGKDNGIRHEESRKARHGYEARDQGERQCCAERRHEVEHICHRALRVDVEETQKPHIGYGYEEHGEVGAQFRPGLARRCHRHEKVEEVEYAHGQLKAVVEAAFEACAEAGGKGVDRQQGYKSRRGDEYRPAQGRGNTG